MAHGSEDYYNPAYHLTKLLRQAMGEATTIHASGTGSLADETPVKILDAWEGRTAFSVSNVGGVSGRISVGGSTDCGMASIGTHGEYMNETWCGDVYIAGRPTTPYYAFEEW